MISANRRSLFPRLVALERDHERVGKFTGPEGAHERFRIGSGLRGANRVFVESVANILNDHRLTAEAGVILWNR